MRLQLLAIGTRMPSWVNEAYRDYADRLPAECRLELREIAMPKRHRSSKVEALKAREAEDLLGAVPKANWVIALDARGKSLTTEALADQLDKWLQSGRDVSLLVGGPDGLDAQVRQSADWSWSLSPLTFPHPLVRVVVAEQLYRAWSLLHGHPYHRGD